MVERSPDKTEVVGSIPTVRTRSALSSVVERHIDIVKAVSSILTGRTNKVYEWNRILKTRRF
jgi:hypothetical protein